MKECLFHSKDNADLTDCQLATLYSIKGNPSISFEQMTKKTKASMSTIRRNIKTIGKDDKLFQFLFLMNITQKRNQAANLR